MAKANETQTRRTVRRRRPRRQADGPFAGGGPRARSSSGPGRRSSLRSAWRSCSSASPGSARGSSPRAPCASPGSPCSGSGSWPRSRRSSRLRWPGRARHHGAARPGFRRGAPAGDLARRHARQRRRSDGAGPVGGASGAARAVGRGAARRPACAAHGRARPLRPAVRRGDDGVRRGGRGRPGALRAPRRRLRLAGRRRSARRGREPDRRLDRSAPVRRPSPGGDRRRLGRPEDPDGV